MHSVLSSPIVSLPVLRDAACRYHDSESGKRLLVVLSLLAHSKARSLQRLPGLNCTEYLPLCQRDLLGLASASSFHLFRADPFLNAPTLSVQEIGVYLGD